MTYNTHLYLGSVMYPVIRENWGIPLSRKRFLYGCVKPDITSLFIRHPHFWKYSRKYFFRKLGKLAASHPETGRKNKKFSEDLGVVLHYAADFFTSAHNISPNRIQQHIEFESRLYDAMLQLVDTDSIRQRLRFLRELPGLAADTGDVVLLIEELSRLHKTYKSDLDRPTSDINRIVHASILITCGIMDAVSQETGCRVKVSV